MTDIRYPQRALNSSTDSVTIAGTIVSSNPSVGPTGAAVPASAGYIGVNVGGTLTGAIGNSNGLLVSSAQASFSGTLASPSVGTVIAPTAIGGYNHFSIFVTLGTATLQVQESFDNVTWYTTNVIINTATNTLPVSTINATGSYSGDLGGQYVRVQALTNTVGTISVNLTLADGPRHDQSARYVGLVGSNQIIGTVRIDQTTPGTTNGVQVVAPLPAGTNAIGGVTQSGTWNINNLSGTVSLPTGAATAAKQPALGTAGTASADVITVQGISGMTALKVDGSAVTQPVSIASIPAGSGRSRVLLYRNNYSSVNLTTSAYLQVTVSTSGAINRLYIADTSGSAIILATGAAGAEVDQLYIGPGGSDAPYELTIPTATRVSVKALDVNATSGQLIITALS